MRLFLFANKLQKESVVYLAAVFSIFVFLSSRGGSAEYKVDKSMIDKLAQPTVLMNEVKEMIAMMESVVSISDDSIPAVFGRNIFFPSVNIVSGLAVNEGGRTNEKGNSLSNIPDILGVVIGEGGRFVIFRDKEVKEGESYGEIKVVKISLSSVVLETGDGVREIILE